MVIQVLISALGLGVASLVGSLVGLFVKRISHRWNDIFLGYCAGMMLAAAIVCLILPAMDMTGAGGSWQVFVGVAAGVAIVGVLDRIVPHLHHLTGLDTERHRGNVSVNRVLLFVTAIAIHKLPEGMATGIVFNGDSIQNAYAVAVSIALQNIPEGMVVVTPLLMIGVGYMRAVMMSLIVAVIEMAGVCLGYFLGDISSVFMPVLLGMAGGAMLYVISDEMIPETHSHGFEKYATYALVAGVMSMLLIQALA